MLVQDLYEKQFSPILLFPIETAKYLLKNYRKERIKKDSNKGLPISDGSILFSRSIWKYVQLNTERKMFLK
jgi:hypothetical protein